MQCSKCHYEFSTADHPYCPVCGTPVRQLLPPLPPRQGINGCLLGCLISVVAFFVIFIILPLVLLIAGCTFCGDRFSFDDLIRQATEQMDSDFEVAQSSSFKYNLYGTLSQDTAIHLSLDQPTPNNLQGHLYISSATNEDFSQPYEVSGTISPSGNVSLTVTDPATQQKQQWRGVAVTNPDGIAAIKGTVKPGGQEFYVTRQ